MQLYSIASGSSGNCIYAGTDKEGVLFDAGISFKRIKEGLEVQGLSLENIRAICITHEHSDHISGLGPILRKVPIPVYATAGTIDAIWEKTNMNNISPALFHSVRPGEETELAGGVVRSFPISHDAAEPVCYTLERDGKKIGIATDTGCYNDKMIDSLAECDTLLLEANHDINMLQVGRYPYALKMRILSDRGHLSNDASARFIRELLHDGLQHIMLGHLSRDNNFPELAFQTVSYELEQSDIWRRLSVGLSVANRDIPSPVIHVK